MDFKHHALPVMPRAGVDFVYRRMAPRHARAAWAGLFVTMGRNQKRLQVGKTRCSRLPEWFKPLPPVDNQRTTSLRLDSCKCIGEPMATVLIQKAKDGGLDVIDTYVFWNLHEPSPGNPSESKG